MKGETGKRLREILRKNKYPVLMLAVGLLLILLPTGGRNTAEEAEEMPQTQVFSVAEEEARLTETLRSISGAGEVQVLLSVRSTAQRQIARDPEGEVVLSSDSGSKDAVELYYSYPDYLGAVVVCQGADLSAVRLAVTEAVASFTGLGADKITVIKMKS